MICKSCGTTILDTAKFCPKCGNPTGATIEPIAQPAPQPTLQPAPQPQAPQPTPQPQAPQPAPQPQTTQPFSAPGSYTLANGGLRTCGLVLIILAGFGFIFGLFRSFVTGLLLSELGFDAAIFVMIPIALLSMLAPLVLLISACMGFSQASKLKAAGKPSKWCSFNAFASLFVSLAFILSAIISTLSSVVPAVFLDYTATLALSTLLVIPRILSLLLVVVSVVFQFISSSQIKQVVPSAAGIALITAILLVAVVLLDLISLFVLPLLMSVIASNGILGINAFYIVFGAIAGLVTLAFYIFKGIYLRKTPASL